MKSKIIYYLDKLFERLISAQQLRQAQNIRYQRIKRANESTVDYVEKHMLHVSSVASKWKVFDVALKTVSLDGLFLEFGVFKGVTINYIAKQLSGQIYGFDSFEGLPEFWRDGFGEGTFATTGLPKVKENVTLIKGLFDDSLPTFISEHRDEQVAFLHVDCDLYSSTKTIFQLLHDKIKPGTVIVFDEYFNFPGWQNDEYKAFQEFIQASCLSYEYLTYNYLHEQVAVRII